MEGLHACPPPLVPHAWVPAHLCTVHMEVGQRKLYLKGERGKRERLERTFSFYKDGTMINNTLPTSLR